MSPSDSLPGTDRRYGFRRIAWGLSPGRAGSLSSHRSLSTRAVSTHPGEPAHGTHPLLHGRW